MENNTAIIRVVVVSSITFLISAFYIGNTWDDRLVGYLSDDAVFLLSTDIFSPWVTGRGDLLDYIYRQSQFPPLYPLAMSLFGVTSATPALAQTITTIFLLSTVCLFSYWVWIQTKNFIVSIAMMLLFSLLPATILFSQELWSEFLYMAIVMSAFLTWDNADKDRRWLLVAALVSLAALTRISGVALIAAFILMLIKFRPRQWKLVFAISTTPFAAWLVYRKFLVGGEQYSNTFFGKFQGETLSSVLNHYLSHMASIWDGWVWDFAVSLNIGLPGWLSLVILALFAILSLTGLVVRAREWHFDAWFCLFSLGLIILWPFTGNYFTSRFLYPLIPLFIFYGWQAFQLIFQYIKIENNTAVKSIVPYTPLFLLVIVMLPVSINFIQRSYESVDNAVKPFVHTRKWYTIDNEKKRLLTVLFRRDLIKILTVASKYIDEGECVYSTHAPFVMLHTRRISYLLPNEGVADEFFRQQVHDCKYILAMKIHTMYFKKFYPLDREFIKNEYDLMHFQVGTSPQQQPIVILAIKKDKVAKK